MLLQVVALARDVGRDLDRAGDPDTRDLAQRGVRLLRRRREDARADAAALGSGTFFLRPLPDFRPGVASFFVLALRPFRTSWLVVGMRRVMVAACIAPARREPRRDRPRGRAGIRRRRGRCRTRGRGLRRKARRGRSAGGDRRGAPDRRRVLVLRLHAVEGAAAPGATRSTRRGACRARPRRSPASSTPPPRWRGATRSSTTSTTRSWSPGSRTGGSRSSAGRRPSRASAACASATTLLVAERAVVLATGSDADLPPDRRARRGAPVDEPGGDDVEGRPRPPARPRRGPVGVELAQAWRPSAATSPSSRRGTASSRARSRSPRQRSRTGSRPTASRSAATRRSRA